MIYWQVCKGSFHKSVSIEFAKNKIQKEIDKEMLQDGYDESELNKIETVVRNGQSWEVNYRKPYQDSLRILTL